jgi:undecaprenyl diphosphate synthase
MTGELLAISNKEIYSDEELAQLDSMNIPQHIAIIMDGNRRWEKQHGFPPMTGHWQGAETLTNIVSAALELSIKTLTVYAFSTENWTRSQEEIDYVMHLFEVYLMRQRKPMQEKGVRLSAIGNLKRMRENTKKILQETIELTKHGMQIDLVLALNYGGRDEICRAVKKLIDDYDQKKITKEELNEDVFSKYLDTTLWQDPDLIIRTSGEKRLSNFLLWQSSYSEVYFEEVCWPDFSEKKLFEAVLAYQKRKRRYGQ